MMEGLSAHDALVCDGGGSVSANERGAATADCEGHDLFGGPHLQSDLHSELAPLPGLAGIQVIIIIVNSLYLSFKKICSSLF